MGKIEVTKQNIMEELNREEYGTYIDSAKKGEKFNEGEINKQL